MLSNVSASFPALTTIVPSQYFGQGLLTTTPGACCWHGSKTR